MVMFGGCRDGSALGFAGHNASRWVRDGLRLFSLSEIVVRRCLGLSGRSALPLLLVFGGESNLHLDGVQDVLPSSLLSSPSSKRTPRSCRLHEGSLEQEGWDTWVLGPLCCGVGSSCDRDDRDVVAPFDSPLVPIL